MNQYLISEQHNKETLRADKPASASVLCLCLTGFVLLLSGILLFILTTIDAFGSNEGTSTMISVLICLGMYRVGKFLLQQVGKVQVSKLSVRPERRRSVLS